MKIKIGTNAGLVWEKLSELGGNADLKAIKKATKLAEKDLYAALGWLAREDKVVFKDNNGETFVGLA
ncbi:MAG: winged helix-turn-helix domain-containing protein [Prevotellaceae bacterium]|jgi:hypothetical protein|nr:winged helix-turn-helix domain-containing protein [Prevotellaceae bacterium]